MAFFLPLGCGVMGGIIGAVVASESKSNSSVSTVIQKNYNYKATVKITLTDSNGNKIEF